MPHLCLCAEVEELRCVIIESFAEGRIEGACHLVHALATADTFRILADRMDEPCRLLGGPQDKPWAELRNGDIIHFPEKAASFSCRPSWLLGVFCTVLGVGRAQGSTCAVLWLAAGVNCAVAAPTLPLQEVPSMTGHRIWCPWRDDQGLPPCIRYTDSAVGPVVAAPDVLVRLRPSFWDGHTHWVTVRSGQQAVSIVVIGAPAPRALLAKPVLSRSDFLHLL